MVLGSGQKDKYEKELENLGSSGSFSTDKVGWQVFYKKNSEVQLRAFFFLKDIKILLVLLCYLYKQFGYRVCLDKLV